MENVVEVAYPPLSLWAYIYHQFPDVSYISAPFWQPYSREKAATILHDPHYMLSIGAEPECRERMKRLIWTIAQREEGASNVCEIEVDPEDRERLAELSLMLAEGVKGDVDPNEQMMQDYIQLTRTTYEQHAADYRSTVIQHTPLDKMLVEFAGLISTHGKIVDVGCGPGHDILKFLKQGKDVIGVDSSAAMVCLAHEATPVPIYHMDLLDLDTLNTPLEGIWCVATLLHLPRRIVPHTLDVFNRALQGHEGYLFLSVKQGTGSQLVRRERIGGSSRLFTYFSKDELIRYLDNANFEVCKLSQYAVYRNGIGWDVWINTLACKRDT